MACPLLSSNLLLVVRLSFSPLPIGHPLAPPSQASAGNNLGPPYSGRKIESSQPSSRFLDILALFWVDLTINPDGGRLGIAQSLTTPSLSLIASRGSSLHHKEQR